MKKRGVRRKKLEKRKSLRQNLLFSFIFLILMCAFVAYLYISPEVNGKSADEGVLSFSFDEGYKEQYTVVYPLMRGYGFNGTLYLIANSTWFEGRGLMSFEEARGIQEGGWEIGSHSLNHECISQVKLEEAEYSIVESKKILEQEGFKVESFAHPYGCFNLEVDKIIRENYGSSRFLQIGYNFFPITDRHKIYSKMVGRDNSPDEICFWIRTAKERKYWLVLVFHDVLDTPERYYDYQLSYFREVLDCSKRYGIKVETIGEVLDET